MPKQVAWLPCAAAAAIVTALCLTSVVTARAAQPAKQAHVVKRYWHHPTAVGPQSNVKVGGADPFGCTWPYTNQYPPCMSTWPQGDPNYHGSGVY
jgi:hypothetical protein